MYIFNFYEDINRRKASVASSDKNNIDSTLSYLNGIVSSYVKEWHNEGKFVNFRIEVIDQETQEIRNLIWESRSGFFEACSIEKYIQHLINKETYQIWIKDHVDSESICKFAD